MASSKGEFEDHSEAFFQVVGATESRVGLHNSGELDLLFVGQVFFWVLPEGVVGVLQAGRPCTVGAGWYIGGPFEDSSGFVLAGGFAGGIPRVSAHFVEGVGGPY